MVTNIVIEKLKRKLRTVYNFLKGNIISFIKFHIVKDGFLKNLNTKIYKHAQI